MKFSFSSDGSLNIAGLKDAYPEVNGKPVRPLRVEIQPNEAVYFLKDGKIRLHAEEDAGGIRLSCTVSGLSDAHDIAPFGSAEMKTAVSGFRQGFGIEGPSGRFTPKADAKWESSGLIALKAGDSWLCVHARRHERFRNRYRVNGFSLCASFDTEGTLTGETELPELYFREGEDLRKLLSSAAEEIAETMGARREMTSPAFHWCSWYYLYHNIDIPILRDYVQKFKGEADFSHIQLDAGYFPSEGDWLDTLPNFQGSMKEAGKIIRDGGFEPGVWIAPYMVGDQSRLFREHPDWLLHDVNGDLLIWSRQYNEPKIWGYRDFQIYILDTSHPDAMEYLRRVFSTYRAWGYTLFKTDFLLLGMQDSQSVKRYTPGKTSVEYFRDTMKTIREAIGDARWLGCIAPFLPSVGFVDMMRIGGDVGAQWNESGFGPANMLRETQADQYFNRKYWLNDPDAVMLRDFHIFLEAPQIEALALYQAMTGSVVYTSDPVHLLSPERKRLLKMIRPSSLISPEFPHWLSERDDITVVNRASGGFSVLVFNPTPKAVTVKAEFAEITGISNPCVRAWHEGLVPANDCLVIPPREAKLYFVSQSPLEREPENVWNW